MATIEREQEVSQIASFRAAHPILAVKQAKRQKKKKASAARKGGENGWVAVKRNKQTLNKLHLYPIQDAGVR